MDELVRQLVSSYGWSAETFAIWKLSDFRCTYCGLNMLGTLEAHRLGQIDHILPRYKYTNLIAEPTNLTLSCQICNFLKGRHDPNGTPPVLPIDHRGEINSADRAELIARAKHAVNTKRIEKTRKFLDMAELMMNAGVLP